MTCAMRNPVDDVIGLLRVEGFTAAAQQLRDEADAGTFPIATTIEEILAQIDAVLYHDPEAETLRLRRLSQTYDVVRLPGEEPS